MVVRYSKYVSATLAALFFLSSYILSAQGKDKIFFDDFVEVFYADTTEALIIYDEYEGEVAASLNPYGRFCWYKIAIAESRGEWMRIENINVVPCGDEPLARNQEKHKGQWIKSEHLRLFLSYSGGTLYSRADTQARVVLSLNKGVKCKLIDIEGAWAKVSLLHNGKLYVGWIDKMYQCPLPYTTCNYNFPSAPEAPKK